MSDLTRTSIPTGIQTKLPSSSLSKAYELSLSNLWTPAIEVFLTAEISLGGFQTGHKENAYSASPAHTPVCLAQLMPPVADSSQGQEHSQTLRPQVGRESWMRTTPG